MKKKIVKSVSIPEFRRSIAEMPEDSKIFVDKSLEIANHIFQVMRQKGFKQKDLAERMGKSEAEVSKLLAGMHNYTLRSIAKLEAALGSAVICTPKQVSHVFTQQLTAQPPTTAVVMRAHYVRPTNIVYGAKVVDIAKARKTNEELVAI